MLDSLYENKMIIRLGEQRHEFKKDPIFYGKSRVKDENVNLVEEIEYKPNRLVLTLNTLYSFMSLEKMFPDYRKHNIIGELFVYEFKIFKLNLNLLTILLII